MKDRHGAKAGLSRRSLVYGLVVTALTAVGVEMAVRALGLAPPLPVQYTEYVSDPVLPHRPRPNSVVSGRSEFDEFDFEYQHNSWGFRDDNPSTPKPDGTFRIVGLGDSFTYGIGSPIDSTYLSLLEARLLRAHPLVDVVKMGIPRFFPEPELRVLEMYGATLSPDLVIVGFVPNDVVDTRIGVDGTGVSPEGWLMSRDGADAVKKFGPRLMQVYLISHTFRLLFRGVVRTMSTEASVVWTDVYHAGGSLEPDWLEVERQLGAIATLAQDLGAQLMVVHLPQAGPWQAQAYYPPTRLAKWARVAGVHFVDVLPALEAHGDLSALTWRRDGHATPLANDLMATVIGEYIESAGLVP